LRLIEGDCAERNIVLDDVVHAATFFNRWSLLHLDNKVAAKVYGFDEQSAEGQDKEAAQRSLSGRLIGLRIHGIPPASF
jgi:hypothetical protein